MTALILQRRGPLLALALLLALIGLVVGAIIMPLAAHHRAGIERREQLAATIFANRARIAALPALTRELADESRALGPLLLPRSPEATASADQAEQVRALLETAAQASGAIVISSQSDEDNGITATDSPGTDPGRWAKATLEARLTRPQLVALLARLDSSRPLLAIDALTIAPHSSPSPSELIDVRIEASALAAALAHP